MAGQHSDRPLSVQHIDHDALTRTAHGHIGAAAVHREVAEHYFVKERWQRRVLKGDGGLVNVEVQPEAGL